MNRFQRLMEDLSNLEELTRDILVEILRDRETDIIELNTEDQLFEKGINTDGVAISELRPYTPLTIKLKSLKGQPTDRVTLRDEGDFHQSFFLDITRELLFFDATDEKTRELVEKYGENIFGLTKENLLRLQQEIIKPEFSKRLRKRLLR